MNDLPPPWPLFWAFLLASLVLALTPGPEVLLIVTRSLVQGRISGLASVAGIALGDLGNALAALGLAAFVLDLCGAALLSESRNGGRVSVHQRQP